MTDLKPYFITVNRPFKEGTVEVFEQAIDAADLSSIEKASLTITALGVYEASINGAKAGDIMFAPGYTYYPKDLHVQVYDVTDMLKATQNPVLKVMLAQGWYCGRFTCDNKVQIYGSSPAVSWVLEVETKDGKTVKYTSCDSTVKAVKSPYALASMYDGEVYFAKGAKGADETDEVIQPVPYDGKLPEVLETCDIYVNLQEEMPVKAVSKKGDTTILDFGQNFAGVITIDPAHLKGGTLTIRHGEILNADGSLYTNNLRKARCTLVYHKGDEAELYTPRFTYMGFRYAELTGAEYEEGLITAHALYSDMQRIGHFESSDKSVEKLYQNQVWGQKSNYVEVPTDCPQRDERMGYTGDGHVFAATGAYNFDTEKFWAKFLKDIRYSQMDNKEGYVAPTIPAQGPAGVGFLSMLGWGNCDTIVPELLYHQYGTDKYIREQYESMRLFVECEIRHMGGLLGKKNLWISPSLGDWLAMGRDVKYMAMHNGPVSNAFIVNDLRIMTWAAGYLDKKDDAERYAAQLKKTRAAYIKAFVKKDGTMRDDYQGAYIMALKFVLERGELWSAVFAKLVAKIKAEGMQTGFFATEHILPLLADNGEAKLAFDLLLQENCPGWMYQIRNGATTTWERWDALCPDGTVNETSTRGGDDNMVSFNHYSFGSVGKFYYQYILGIKPAEPGYAKLALRPFIDARLGSVKGSLQTRRGEIKVEWQCKDGKVRIKVEVPVETALTLPSGEVKTLSQGSYAFDAAL